MTIIKYFWTELPAAIDCLNCAKDWNTFLVFLRISSKWTPLYENLLYFPAKTVSQFCFYIYVSLSVTIRCEWILNVEVFMSVHVEWIILFFFNCCFCFFAKPVEFYIGWLPLPVNYYCYCYCYCSASHMRRDE